LIASNNSTVGLPGGSNPPGTPTTITTVDGGTVTFTSGAEGNGWGGQFIGSATTTNRFTGPVSVNGTMSFSNFLGVVQIALTGNFRFNTALGGGDNTTFVFESGSVHTRDSQTASLGTISGGGNTSGIIGTGTAGQIGTWAIGAKNVDATFHGFFSGSNNLIKIGSAGLTFDGRMYYTNTVTLADPFEPTNVVNFTLFSNAVTYTGLTTVSNGILSIVSPNNLTNSTGIRLAGDGAVLDASQIGYLSNQITLDYFSAPQATNSVAVVTKTVDLVGTQTLTGSGTIWGSVNAAPTTTVAPGFSVGTLTITNTAGLYGTINMELNRSSTPNADLIVAPVINVSGATLNVTNIGPDLVTGDVYQLFSGPVIGTLAATNLPVQNQAATVTYVWTNMLAINGSIKVLSGASPVNPTPTSISYSVAANQLSLSWPPDHLGWDLQTNSTSIANPSAWFTYPGSTSVTNVVLTVEPTKPQVFYRLHLQTP
jgi:hypothetical protein